MGKRMYEFIAQKLSAIQIEKIKLNFLLVLVSELNLLVVIWNVGCFDYEGGQN